MCDIYAKADFKCKKNELTKQTKLNPISANPKYKPKIAQSKNRNHSRNAFEKVFSIDSNAESQQVFQELCFLGDIAGVFGVFAANWLHSSG